MEGLGYEDLAGAPGEHPDARDFAQLEVSGIRRFGYVGRVSQRFGITRRRRLQLQRVVRPLFVIDPPELVERPLLRGLGGAHALLDRLLECAMPPFMCAIVLRLSRP